MKNVHVVSGQVLTSLGFTTPDHIRKLKNGETGIRLIHNSHFSPDAFYASLVDTAELNSRFSILGDPAEFTRLEKLLIITIADCLDGTGVDLKDRDTLLVISTTKGNIDLLERHNQTAFDPSRAYLHMLGQTLQHYFNAFHVPVMVCNACISGVLGIIHAARLIRALKYKHVVVCGGDITSSFTVAGFQSFKAIGSGPCKPYDAARDGLSLGEGAGAMLLSGDEGYALTSAEILVKGGAVSNDANHISGPSRTGSGLLEAIRTALAEPGLESKKPDYISAHGTATSYNDEMECLAIHSAGLQDVPVNSFKGAIGHTLGGAGVIESILAVEALKSGVLLPSVGFENPGVTQPLNVIKTAVSMPLRQVLKTASGFGGCNAAVVFAGTND